jgi:hypothetical protein
MRRLLLAALISAAGILPAAARDQFTGDLTEKQIMAIKVATIARFAGTHDNCPGVQFSENASFKVMIDAGIRPEMLGSTEFSNVVAEAILGAGEKLQENRSDWCAATWELFGPGTHLRWQMLEKVNSR